MGNPFYNDVLCHLWSRMHPFLTLLSFCLVPSTFCPLFYLFVGLGVQNTHTLHCQAGVAQWTGVTAEARGSIHTLHSREAGVKLALQKEGHEHCWSCKMNVVLTGLLPESFLGLMTLLLMQKRECWRGQSLEKGSVQTRKDIQANTHACIRIFVLLSSWGPHWQQLTRVFQSWTLLYQISFCAVPLDSIRHFDDPIGRSNF